MTFDTIISGNIGAAEVGGVHLSSGAVNSGHVASGAVLGSVGGGAFTIASGSIGPNDLGSGSVLSGAIASGQVGQNHLALLSVNTQKIQATSVRSGQLGSGAVIGQAGGGSFIIASGTIGTNDLGSGAVVSGTIASGQVGRNAIGDTTIVATQMSSGSVLSGSIGSGQVGNLAIASGAVTSGRLGTTNVPDGTKFLRDDFAWVALAATVNSGDIGSGKIASGAVQGFYGTTRHIASGTVGVFDLGSGAVVAGTVGSGAIVSGNIASGQVGGNAVAAIANLTDNGFLVTAGIISPTDIGTQDDWNPAGLTNATHVRCANSTGSLTINGIAGGVNGRILTISAMDANAVQLVNNALTSTAANRISTPDADTISLPALSGGATSGNTIILIYDGTIARWRVLAINSTYIATPTTIAHHLLIQAGLAMSGVVAPASITGNVNDYTPGGDLFAAIINQDCTANATITGMSMVQSTYAGKVVSLNNISASFSITISNEDFNSVAANRFTLANAAPLVIPPLGSVLLRYNTASSRWKPMADSTVLASGQVSSGLIRTNAVVSGTIGSGAVQGVFGATRHIASGTVGTFDLGSGAVIAGAVGSGAVVSGNIASGVVGQFHVASGAVSSGRLATTNVPDGTKFLRDDFAWVALAATVNSGDIGSGKIASGAVQGFFGTTRHIASGTIGSFDLGSGAVIAGTVGSGAIVSGNIASGVVGNFHVSSGAITSGKIGVNPVSAPNGTKFLRDDYSWQTVAAVVGSGDISSGKIASGAVQGFFGATRHIASGTVGGDDLGSGAVRSGAIASGQVGKFHLSSGASISFSRGVMLEQWLTTEVISGVRCVALDPTISGAVRIAMAATSGRMPAIGVAFLNALSGQPIDVVRYGAVTGPASELGSGIYTTGKNNAASPFQGRSLFVGASGSIITFTTAVTSQYMGVGNTNSGAYCQKMGHNLISGGADLLIDPGGIIASGSDAGANNFRLYPI